VHGSNPACIHSESTADQTAKFKVRSVGYDDIAGDHAPQDQVILHR
jgi:hypothetical protein